MIEQIVINLPDENAEGYFDLLEKTAALQAAQKENGFTPEVVVKMRQFCAQFIQATDEADREAKSHRLSKKNFKDIMAALGEEEKVSDTIPPA